MFRILFAFLLLAHGLIHVLGFVNQWHLAAVRQMTNKTLIPVAVVTSKWLGLCWLLISLGFLVALVGYWFRHDWWQTVALVSVILSQALIILYWTDARTGTVGNVLILLALGLSYAHTQFEQRADSEAQQLMSQEASDKTIVTQSMLVGLPTPVQQWLTTSGVVGKERVHTVRLRQHGLMRTSPDGQWLPTEAEQYIGVDEPGFIWKADVRMLSFLPLAGRDKYANGKGNMLIKALSVLPIVNASDAKTDQGTLLRYLGEMCWYPSAALSPFITWQSIDAYHAQATMTYKGVSASAIFMFDEQHRLAGVSAKRYKGSGAESQLADWYIPVRDWKLMDGVTIPVKGDVIWKLPAGDFNYYQWEITDIDYNKPVLY
ncbi:DUF6544 family protein [Spirosoma sp. KNUC1025]|uniref:DUF6544 family protein n=1 Tax=Spirosoma sp. KNUC1025 TaxID=2894082 RepID=UPI003866473C|nr:hypothetical protein LN737_13980 [Spirosoma sp. KNUC1025]